MSKKFPDTRTEAPAYLVKYLERKKQQKSKTLARALAKIKENIEQGSSFSKALADFPSIFDHLFILIVYFTNFTILMNYAY